MPQQIVQLVYPALVLFFVLFALIVSDRAFPLRVRRMFYLMLLISLILVLMDGSSGWLAGQGSLSGSEDPVRGISISLSVIKPMSTFTFSSDNPAILADIISEYF